MKGSPMKPGLFMVQQEIWSQIHICLAHLQVKFVESPYENKTL